MPLDYRYYRSFYAINQSYRLDDVTAGVDNINQKLRGIQTYEGPFSAFSTYVTTMTDNSASTSVPQNTAVVFTVTLIQQFAQEQTLYITRTGTAVLSFPATITVPANSSTVTFTATWGIDGRTSGSLSAQFFGRLYSSQGPIVAQSRTFTTPGLTCTYSITDTSNNVISSVYEGSNYKIRYSISGLGTASSTGGGAWSVETASSDVTLLTNMSTFSVNGPGTYDINYLAATDNLLEGSWNYQHYLRLTINGTTYTLASPTVTLNDSNLGAFSLTVGLVGNLKQNDLLSISVTAPQNASRAAMFYWKIVNVTGIDSSDFWATSGTFDIWSGTTYGNISIGTTITGRTDTRQFKVQILNGSYYGAVLAETAVISFDTSEFSATLDFCDRSVGSAPYTAITQVQEGQTFSLRLSITGIGTYATNSSYLNYSGSTTATDPTQWTTRPSYFTYGAEPTSYVDMKLTDDSVTESPSNVIISMTIGNLTVTSTTLSVIDVPAIVANIYVFTRKVGGVDWDPGSYSYLYIPSGGDTVFNVAIQNYPFSTIQWSLYNQGQIGNTYGPTVEDFTDPNPAFNYVLGGINLEYFNEIKHTINLTVDSYDPTIKNGIINISTAINEKTPIFVGSTSGSTLTVSSISSGRMWKGTHLKVVANPTFWIQNPPRVFRQLTGTPWGTGTYEIDNTTPTVSSETLTLVEEIINFGIKLYNPSNSLVFSKTFYIAPA